MNDAAVVLELRDISVRLGGRRRWLLPSIPAFPAVSNVNLEINAGEILGLVGESGCGKTTLGRTVLGLQRESAGSIKLNGEIVTGLEPRDARRKRRAIHYVHQDAAAALDPWWSVGHALEEGLIIQGVPHKAERQQRMRDMQAAVGLDSDAAKRYPHELSGGQLRRIALARVLLLRPSIIILDEPTSGLDMSVQATILNLLLDLRQRLGLTYLFISHDLSVVRKLCDRVAIMYLGRIIEIAPAERIFTRPLHPYTQALLAAVPRLEPQHLSAPQIRGDLPTSAPATTGCSFAPRCPHALPLCAAQQPVLEIAETGHEIACHRWRELAQ